jgi:hypothetical protein
MIAPKRSRNASCTRGTLIEGFLRKSLAAQASRRSVSSRGSRGIDGLSCGEGDGADLQSPLHVGVDLRDGSRTRPPRCGADVEAGCRSRSVRDRRSLPRARRHGAEGRSARDRHRPVGVARCRASRRWRDRLRALAMPSRRARLRCPAAWPRAVDPSRAAGSVRLRALVRSVERARRPPLGGARASLLGSRLGFGLRKRAARAPPPGCFVQRRRTSGMRTP